MGAQATARDRIVAYALLGNLFGGFEGSMLPTEEQALSYLGAIVEMGKEATLESLRRDNGLITNRDLEEIIRMLRDCVKEEALLRDSSFEFSLRLAIFRIADQDIDNWKANFKERLAKIFPEPLCEKLFHHIINRVTTEVREGKEFLPTKEGAREHFERRQRLHEQYFQKRERMEAQLSLTTRRSTGTHTRLEPCPQCGLEKRCDAKTKRFRCKACGLDQPYPFKPV